MTEHAKAAPDLPFDIHREMVDSLFGRINVLFSGLVAHAVCLIVCWAATDDLMYFVGIPFFSAVVVYRLVVFHAFKRALPQIDNAAGLDKWERLYMIGGCLTALGVGIAASYAVLTSPTTIASAIGMGLVGGSMISVVGRNFSSLQNARLMTYACCFPLIVGFLLGGWVQGDHLVALTCVPLIIVVTTSVDMSKHLNGLLVGALRSVRVSEIGSQRFNAAISSMPNGLLMVDGDGKIVVSNERALDMLGLSSTDGITVQDALVGTVVDMAAVLAALRIPESEQDDFDSMTFETKYGNHLRFRVRHLESGEKRFMDDEWGGKQEGAYVLTILDVSKKVASDKRIQHLARTDVLTQIANRGHWESTSHDLVASLPRGGLVGLAVLDVDRFKLINDTLGHHIGDEVIKGVASRLVGVGDQRMFVGRLGGDEFVVLIPGLEDAEEARQVFNRVFAAISCTYVIDAHNVDVRCSGGAIVRTRETFNLHADMSRADMALYKVKRNPNQSWMLFDAALEEEYQSSIRIKHDLRHAIEKGKLEVVYQPIYDAKGERIVSAEALCRWEHPEAGPIPPSQFIALAEEIGVIGQLTEYVLRTACRDCANWNPAVTVSVNLSAIDLARDGIVDMISNALVASKMPPSRLCIEVTESVFVKDFDKTARTLLTLRGMGVKTSLDDFGTGYSSLSYMHRLPLNRVKIDRSFVLSIVTDPKTQQLFRAVVGLAKSLGFEVIVEGVEDRDQLEYVVSVAGVDMIQGHIFSHGLTNDDMISITDVKRPGWNNGKVLRLV